MPTFVHLGKINPAAREPIAPWVDAMKSAGWESSFVDIAGDYLAQIRDIKPDIVFTRLRWDVARIDMLNEFTKTCWYFCDFREAHEEHWNSIVNTARACSIVTANGGYSAMQLEVETGRKVHCLPMPVDLSVYNPDSKPKRKKFDVCFHGKRKPHREAVTEKLRKDGLSVIAYGDKWGAGPAYHDKFSPSLSGRVNLNMPEFEGWPTTISSRLGRLLCCKEFVLSQDGNLRPFVHGVNIACYDSGHEVETVRWFLGHPEVMEGIADRGHRWATANLSVEGTGRSMNKIFSGQEK